MQTDLENGKDVADDAIQYGKDILEDTSDSVKEGLTQLKGDPNGVEAGQNTEGSLTKRIESVTTKIPSATFLSLAIGSIAVSGLLRIFGKKQDAIFVGEWVPTILILGLYNKLVKLEGSE